MNRGKGFQQGKKRKGNSMPIELLIDGYNLMFQSVATPDPRDGLQALQRAREYMLRYLADRLDANRRARTWIVFDSSTDLHLPTETTHRDLRVTFARDHNSADELLIQIIQSHSSPNKLTVVSSDHQIQRRAKARGAKFFDSEDWITYRLPSDPLPNASEVATEQNKQKDAPMRVDSLADEREFPISAEEKERWLDEFGF